MLVGVDTFSKSVLMNCLLNPSSDIVQEHVDHKLRSNSTLTIIDTFAIDHNISARNFLSKMRDKLNHVNNTIDLVLFVIKHDSDSDRLINETLFIQTFQQDVLHGKARFNSALVVNGCERAWLAEQNHQSYPLVQKIFANVNNRSFEFSLQMDRIDDEPETKKINFENRMKEIQRLFEFLNTQLQTSTEPIWLGHIQKEEFEKLWCSDIFRLFSSFLCFQTPKNNDRAENSMNVILIINLL